ncbi:MAG: hypothetical protein LIO59_07050, partial [Oscillospiraceae bacterium]|nr:hypothetical protein [Oscillospiraceae bacterium]
MSVYEDSEVAYNRDEFYQASNNSTADVFLCVETGKVFTPGENALFEFLGEYEPYLQKSIEPQEPERQQSVVPEPITEKEVTADDTAVDTADNVEPVNYEQYIGREIELDDRRFVVEHINDLFNTVELRDVTFQNGTGFPIF